MKVKVETFINKDTALNRVGNASMYRATQTLMAGDVLADENGNAWTVKDTLGRLLREDGLFR